MATFEAVTSKADLATLDQEDIVQGYLEGLLNEPEPGHNRGRAVWHGWRNGMVDGGWRQKDVAQAELARAVVGRRAPAGETLH